MQRKIPSFTSKNEIDKQKGNDVEKPILADGDSRYFRFLGGVDIGHCEKSSDLISISVKKILVFCLEVWLEL